MASADSYVEMYMVVTVLGMYLNLSKECHPCTEFDTNCDFCYICNILGPKTVQSKKFAVLDWVERL